ncbi:hypothetical protein KIPB_014544, partial [Kipferlia bialata]|eukprot:g14544.t1
MPPPPTLTLTPLTTPSECYLDCRTVSSAVCIGNGRVLVVGPDHNMGYSCHVYTVTQGAEGEREMTSVPIECPLPRYMQ